MDGKLNLIRQFRAFNQKKNNTLKSADIAIYVALLGIANDSSHEGGINQTVSVDNERLMKLAGIGSEKTLVAHRDALQRLGFISYVSGGAFVNGIRISGKYTLIKLY